MSELELTWFRRPAGDDPGRLNLCFNALDLHVVRGKADEVVVAHDGANLDRARLLEQVAALAGALRGLGVEPGSTVGVVLDDPLDDLLLLLACARVGAAYVALPEAGPRQLVDTHRPHVVATSRSLEFGEHVPAACLVRGFPPAHPARDVDWELAIRAGRTDPAPCADLPPDLITYVVGDEAVSIVDALDHDARQGRQLAALVAGDPLSL